MEFSKIKITSKEFIGRKNELAEIQDMVNEASTGKGTLLLLSGEAGIGKTRLVSEFVDRSSDQNIQYLRGRCKYHQGLDPYSPFIEALRNWFGLLESMDDKNENEKISDIICKVSPELISIMPLIRGFLSAGTSIYGSYLFKGSNIKKSFNTFKELMQPKRLGLCITRTHPDEVNKQYELESSQMYWLTRSPTEIPSLDPSHIEKLRWVIKDFVSKNKNSVVLLDGLEYLILQNNFENVLKFVELLKDDIALNNAVLILPIDPATLGSQQIALFERYMHVISSEFEDSTIASKMPNMPNLSNISIPEYQASGYQVRPIDMDYVAEKDKMFQAILLLIKNIASKKPLILFIDDLHWADRSSIQLLQYLFQNMVDKNIVIIGSYRPEDINESENFIQTMMENIKKLNLQDSLNEIILDRLTRKDIVQVVKNILDEDVPEKLISFNFQKSEGNPLYVEEILKSLLEENLIDLEDKTHYKKLDISKIEIPDSITEVIRMRINRVTKDNDLVDQILKYVSVIGSNFNFDILLEAMDLNEELLLDNIEKLMNANIIHEVDVDRYKFDHTLIREVIYNDLGSRRKKILHARIGASIEKLYHKNLKDHYVELAHHFSCGGVIDKAVYYSIREAEIAKELCAYDEALFHYRSALDMSTSQTPSSSSSEPEVDLTQLINLHINLGDLSLILGTWSNAKFYFEKALEISKESGDDLKKIESTSKLSQIEIKKDRWSKAVGKLEEVLGLKLDGKHKEILLVKINPKYVIRANISLIKILSKENFKGIYICINHPSTLIDKLLRSHNIPTKNLLFLDFITSIAGVEHEVGDNVCVIDKAFSLDRMLDAFNKKKNDQDNLYNFDFDNIDFVLVDNITNLSTYITEEKIRQFTQDLIQSIKKITRACGIIIMDDKSNPNVQKVIEQYFDKSVTIEEEWL